MTLPNFRFLDDDPAVAEFTRSLRGAGEVALDLEADSLHNYREKVCLVQVSTRDANAVLDPLACREAVKALGPVLADGATLKVVHGGDYDVRLLKKDFGLAASNLFDTMLAAQLTGREHFGLAALLEEHFGVLLDKRYQRADWSARPLGPELLAYAAADTAYLLDLKERLQRELEELGRLHWAQEEFGLLALAEPSPPKSPWCLDVKGAGRLAPRELAVLQELLLVREALAAQWDRPPFKVLSNQVLLEWAVRAPANRRAVLETGGASKPLLARIAEDVVEAVGRAGSLPPERWPRPPPGQRVPLTGAEERRLKRLKQARERAAGRLRLSPGLLVNSATLERFARMDPAEAFEAVPRNLKRWQMEAVGLDLQPALEAASGE